MRFLLVLAFRIVPSDWNRLQTVAGADVQLVPEGCHAIVRGHLLIAKGKEKEQDLTQFSKMSLLTHRFR